MRENINEEGARESVETVKKEPPPLPPHHRVYAALDTYTNCKDSD